MDLDRKIEAQNDQGCVQELEVEWYEYEREVEMEEEARERRWRRWSWGWRRRRRRRREECQINAQGYEVNEGDRGNGKLAE